VISREAVARRSLHCLDMPLLARFQRARWSETRRRMDAMRPGETLALARSEYYNAKSSTDRLNDAYEGSRRWFLKRERDRVMVRHIDQVEARRK